MTIHYEGRLRATDQLFGTSHGGPPISFTLGNEEVIRGWELAIKRMSLGTIALVRVPASLAFGVDTVHGGLQTLPPSADLVFELELLWINDISIRDPVRNISSEADVTKPSDKHSKVQEQLSKIMQSQS